MGSSRRITTYPAGSEGYRRPRWLWSLFDDERTALTTTAVTPRERPLGGARWSCC